MNQKTTLSVRDMGKMLGLKKVESYWLVHKGYFETVLLNGKMRVVTESFENWYARQVKYHKMTGEPPGELLKQDSYSARDIAEMLQISEAYAYEVMKTAGVKPVLVDYWQRFPKDEFDRWYESQTRFRNAEHRLQDAALLKKSMSMPDMARLLDIPRSSVYSILKSVRGRELLEVIVVADQKRITLESFDIWYQGQDRYLKPEDRPEGYVSRRKPYDGKRTAEQTAPAAVPEKKAVKSSTNPEFLTVEQAAEYAGVGRHTIRDWIRRGDIPASQLSTKLTRIPRKKFEEFLAEWQKKPRRR